MKYRPHRGSLSAAMAECVELPATKKALDTYLNGYEPIVPGSVFVEAYSGPDERIGWPETFIVLAKWNSGHVAPIGFTDAMPV